MATAWKLVGLSSLLLLAQLMRPVGALAWGDKGHLIGKITRFLGIYDTEASAAARA